jgi:hypothetical protein
MPDVDTSSRLLTRQEGEQLAEVLRHLQPAPILDLKDMEFPVFEAQTEDHIERGYN